MLDEDARNIYRRTLYEAQLGEGINDRYIFKAVFMAGGPGSGKSFVAESMFTGAGLKFVASDRAFEFLLKRRSLSFSIDPSNAVEYAKQMKTRERAMHLSALQQVGWTNGMLGLVIDGTGQRYAKISGAHEGLQAIGYDTSMVFVNTSLDVALERNQARKRTLSDAVVKGAWDSVQRNLGKFQSLFGAADFLIVDNNEYLSGAALNAFQLRLHRAAMKLLTRPVQNPIGKSTIKLLRQSGGKTLKDLPGALARVA